MKVTRVKKEPVFDPIEVTLETREEAKAVVSFLDRAMDNSHINNPDRGIIGDILYCIERQL